MSLTIDASSDATNAPAALQPLSSDDSEETPSFLSASTSVAATSSSLRALTRDLFDDEHLANVIASEIIQIVRRAHVPSVAPMSEADVILEIEPDELLFPGSSPYEVIERFLDDQLGESVSTLHLHEDATELAHWATSHAASHWQPPLASTLQIVSRLAERYRILADINVLGVSSEHPWYRAYLQGDQRFANFFVNGSLGAEYQFQNPEVILYLVRTITCCSAAGISGFCVRNASHKRTSIDHARREIVVSILDHVLSLLGNNLGVIPESGSISETLFVSNAGLSHALRTAQHNQSTTQFVAYLQATEPDDHQMLLRKVTSDAAELNGFGSMQQNVSQGSDRALDFAFLPPAVAFMASGVPSFRLQSLFGGTQHSSKPNAPWKFDELEAELLNPWSCEARMFERFFSLLTVRTSHAAFHPQSAQHLLALHPDVIAIRRVPFSKEHSNVLFLANLSNATVEVALPTARSFDLLRSHVYTSTVPLAPYGFAVLEQR